MNITEIQQETIDRIERDYEVIGNDFAAVATGECIVTLYVEDEIDGDERAFMIFPGGRIEEAE
jgi:hypothetical protein